MPPVDPSNGCLSLSPLPGDVSARSGRRWPRPKELRFVSFLEFQVGLCLYVTAAVKGGSPRASRTWSQRPKPVQGSLEPVPFSGAHTALTCKLGEVFLGVSNEVRLHRFSSPPFGSPFTFSPSHTSFPLSFHVFPCFMSVHLTPFVLLRVQWSGP